MRVAAKAGIGAVYSLMSNASTAQVQHNDPITGYSCQQVVAGSFGSAQVFAILKTDGTLSHHVLVWEMPARRNGVWLTGTWALGTSPGVPGDQGRVSVNFATGDEDVGQVRIEIWRGREHPLTGIGFRGGYRRAYRSQAGVPFAIMDVALWGDIRTMLSGLDAVSVGVARYPNEVIMAQDRLESSVIDMPGAAVAAAQAGLAPQIPDYSNRCRPMRASDGVP